MNSDSLWFFGTISDSEFLFYVFSKVYVIKNKDIFNLIKIHLYIMRAGRGF